MASATTTTTNTAADPPVFTARKIPDSVSASFKAWIQGDAQAESAKAELHLYKNSGFFQGASLGNVPNLPFAQAWQALKASKASASTTTGKTRPEERATMGTALSGADGKVGLIRLVSLHREGETSPQSLSGWVSSWFPSNNTVKPSSETDTPKEPASLVGRSATTSCGEPRMINMLEVGTPEIKPDETKIVLLHGYGAGTAFFFNNIKMLASVPNSRLFALDWLGMGRSSRPPFHIPNSVVKQGVEARVKAAESFFVDSLEEWRQKMELERMTLVAHSLGGYLSLAYALRFPQRVDKIVLLSPAGIGENPQSAQDGMAFKAKNNASGADASQELRDRQDQIAPTTAAEERQAQAEMRRAASSDSNIRGPSPQGPVSGQSEAEKTEQERQAPPKLSPRTRAMLSWLWDQNLSPFAIIRASTFLGPMMVGRYTSRRFGLLQDDDLRSLHAYCHGIFTAKGSSEYCLAHILAPGAFARWPMLSRIAPLRMPISFMYGEYDWMDAGAGRRAVKLLEKEGNTGAECRIIPMAGHHLYLDHSAATDAAVKEFLEKPLPAT